MKTGFEHEDDSNKIGNWYDDWICILYDVEMYVVEF